MVYPFCTKTSGGKPITGGGLKSGTHTELRSRRMQQNKQKL